MDTVTLWLTSKLIHRPLKALRCGASAGIGAILSTALTCFSAGETLSLVAGIAASIVMCLVAFGFEGGFSFIKRIAVLWTVGMVLGGIMTFLLSRGSYSRVYTDDVVQTESAVYLFPIAVAMSSLFVWFLRRVSRKRIVSVRITHDGHTVETTGIVDSGNFLKDPLTGDGVIIISRDLLPWQITKTDLTAMTLSAYEGLNTKIRLIPVTGVTGSKMLFAIRPDLVKLDGREVRCLIAVSDGEENDNKCIVPESIV